MVSITKEKDGMLWEDMERTLEKEKMDAGKGGIWCMTRKKGKKFTALSMLALTRQRGNC